jgi:DNA polymerase
MARFLPNAKISEIQGQAIRVHGRLIVPMYHPAAALHQPSLRSAVENDFARLPEWMAKTNSVPELPNEYVPAETQNSEQLSLF